MSAKGFYGTALTKARHLGIECLRLEELDSFSWIAPGSMKLNPWRLGDIRCEAIADSDRDNNPVRYRFKAPDGTEITADMLRSNIQKAVGEQISGRHMDAGSYPLKFPIQAPGCFLEDLDTGAVYPLRHFIVTTTLVMECSEIPVRKFDYRVAGSDNSIGRAAIASIDATGISADLVFIRNVDDTTRVLLVPKKAQVPK